MPGGPENKFFLGEALQDEETLTGKMISSEKEAELETEPSEVVKVNEKCKFDKQITLICEAYHLAYGGSQDSLDQYSNLTDIETVMKNSVLHIAAENGNDDIVALLIQRAPRLLFTFNENHDTVLHVAARNGCISTFKKLLEGYTDFERHDIKIAWFNYTLNEDLNEDYDEESNMEHLLNMESNMVNVCNRCEIISTKIKHSRYFISFVTHRGALANETTAIKKSSSSSFISRNNIFTYLNIISDTLPFSFSDASDECLSSSL